MDTGPGQLAIFAGDRTPDHLGFGGEANACAAEQQPGQQPEVDSFVVTHTRKFPAKLLLW
jgi:hypothetical protein